jgi:hypothetical protein
MEMFAGIGLIVATMMTSSWTAAHAADDPVLQSAKITFSLPDGDDKDHNTRVDVFVTTKVNGQWEAVIASLERFGDQQVWEDDGNHSYPYDLGVSAGIKKSAVMNGGVKTQINWHPVGRDRAFFTYTLVLLFSDGSKLQQSSPSLIEMSENIRTYTNP